ncbi:hypothetical protein K2X30_11200 [bacterium]|jgi:hypothetical protein|nr:hypothetical protein [bacterium]
MNTELRRSKIRSSIGAFALVSMTALMAVAFSSCGKTTVAETVAGGAPANNGNYVPTPIPSPIPSDAVSNSLLYSFAVTGQNTTEIPSGNASINTDNLLKVNLKPMGSVNLTLPGYTGYNFSFNCVSFLVEVVDTSSGNPATYTVLASQQTPTLATTAGATNCPQAPTSTTIDFSNRIGQLHGPLKIRVSNARYDLYCDMFNACQTQSNLQYYQYTGQFPYPCTAFTPTYKAFYCPLKNVFQNHTASGNVTVTTTAQ